MFALRGGHPLFTSSTLPQGLPTWAQRCLWWLCVAQLCLPLLGRLHDISHGAPKGAAMVVQADASTTASSSLKDLFGPHTAADCQWFGHLALASGLLGADATIPALALVPYLAPALQALLLRQSPALFFARGPPL